MEDRNENRQPDGEHRFTQRTDVSIEAEIREAGGGRFKIYVLDLSETGFRMKSLTYINPESRITLTLPGMAPLAASVAWAKSDHYGCSFLNPLYPAVLDHIVRQYPSLG